MPKVGRIQFFHETKCHFFKLKNRFAFQGKKLPIRLAICHFAILPPFGFSRLRFLPPRNLAAFGRERRHFEYNITLSLSNITFSISKILTAFGPPSPPTFPPTVPLVLAKNPGFSAKKSSSPVLFAVCFFAGFLPLVACFFPGPLIDWDRADSTGESRLPTISLLGC
jgi:hypothetical protein